ncbi:NDR1/HIN1-like protein 10 [Vigna umbellata]|uniref:NDR1/HIN1-like protein 10 n=1 Tax=Vigna umbellata TaxID=87088 RepID=UPI001F5FE5CC|nr:NDR1/HIN1-like protein 10 [Vigna umbellata]
MADKQPQLNGAYYGPTIPPAEAPRPRRHRNCCCCLFSICWKILLALIIFLVIVFIIFYAVLQPRVFKLHVSDATLTQFNYTSSDNTLRYNLVLNFTAGNPNKKLDFYYESVESHVSYNGVTFASTELLTLRDSFRQRRQSTNRLNGVYRGQYKTVLDQDQVKSLEEDEKKRVFHFSVRLHFKVKFMLNDSASSSTKAKAKCELEVPLSSKGETPVGTVFVSTYCHVNF